MDCLDNQWLEFIVKSEYTVGRNWRGARAVEGARLESVCAFTRTEGSNPSLSDILKPAVTG